MNVTCPSCATVYRVDPMKVPEAGVRARCKICSAIFPVTRLEVTAPRPVQPAVAAPPVAVEPPAPPPPPVVVAPQPAAVPPVPAQPAAPVHPDEEITAPRPGIQLPPEPVIAVAAPPPAPRW